MEEEMDVSQYLEIFLDETNEHLQNLNTQILELESDPVPIICMNHCKTAVLIR